MTNDKKEHYASQSLKQLLKLKQLLEAKKVRPALIAEKQESERQQRARNKGDDYEKLRKLVLDKIPPTMRNHSNVNKVLNSLI